MSHNPYSSHGRIKLFTGTSCPELAQEIGDHLGLPLSGRDIVQFPNENIFVRLHESVRGQDVFLIQTLSSPVNYNVMELLIFLDTLKRACADRITVVIPYFAYARSDKRDQPRVPITARLMANIIGVAGADQYITLDLHADQIQGFFDIPGDVVSVFPILADYFKAKNLEESVVVATDLGFAKKARNMAAELKRPLALIEKRRSGQDTQALTLVGDVSGRDVVLMDDEVDTASSIDGAVELVRNHGARDIYLCFAHAVLSSPATERLRAAGVKEIVTSNSIPVPSEKELDNHVRLSVGPLLGEVVLRVHDGRGVGEMFAEYSQFQ